MKKLCLLLLAMLLSGCSLLDVLNEPAVDLNDDSVTAEIYPFCRNDELSLPSA